jgi:hypothetical protein
MDTREFIRSAGMDGTESETVVAESLIADSVVVLEVHAMQIKKRGRYFTIAANVSVYSNITSVFLFLP